MKILITGSKGQLGQVLTKSNPGYEVIGVDVDELDITDKIAVNQFFTDNDIDVVINAAAYTATDKAEHDIEKAFSVNCTGVRNLAEACKDHGVRMIHISTDYVFDGTAFKPYLTTDPTGPKSVYGKSKLAGEQVLLETLDESVVIRTAWLYSAYGNNFLKTMLRLMKEREELSVVSDQVGTPTSAGTLASAIWRCVGKPKLNDVFHWTDAGVASWYDFAVAIRYEAIKLGLLDESAAKINPINSEEYPVSIPRPFYSVLDNKFTRKALDLEDTHWIGSLRAVLEELVEN